MSQECFIFFLNLRIHIRGSFFNDFKFSFENKYISSGLSFYFCYMFPTLHAFQKQWFHLCIHRINTCTYFFQCHNFFPLLLSTYTIGIPEYLL